MRMRRGGLRERRGDRRGEVRVGVVAAARARGARPGEARGQRPGRVLRGIPLPRASAMPVPVPVS